MTTLHLIHWKREEGEQRAQLLRAAGYAVFYDAATGPALLHRLRADSPAAVVIDLTRLPSQGREVGVALRHSKATRAIPLVFVGGEPEKAAVVQRLLPDAAFTEWGRIKTAVKRAIAHPPAVPVATGSVFEAYRSTPLVKKLGIKPDSVVGLVNAPSGFPEVLGELPAGARLCRGGGARCHLRIWFVRAADELQRDLARVAVDQPTWIVWPKKSGGAATDLNQQVVRKTGLAGGLVDYKICRIDETWAGLLFRRRKQ